MPLWRGHGKIYFIVDHLRISVVKQCVLLHRKCEVPISILCLETTTGILRQILSPLQPTEWFSKYKFLVFNPYSANVENMVSS